MGKIVPRIQWGRLPSAYRSTQKAQSEDSYSKMGEPYEVVLKELKVVNDSLLKVLRQIVIPDMQEDGWSAEKTLTYLFFRQGTRGVEVCLSASEWDGRLTNSPGANLPERFLGYIDVDGYIFLCKRDGYKEIQGKRYIRDRRGGKPLRIARTKKFRLVLDGSMEWVFVDRKGHFETKRRTLRW